MALLDVKDLAVHFHTRNGLVRAVDGISYSLESGETLAIIGESGSGKSVACYSLLGLIPRPPGRIESGSAMFDGRDLLQLPDREIRRVRGKRISIIFQDPMTSLNPYLTIGQQLIEPLRLHAGMDRKAAWRRATTMLEEVGIAEPESGMRAYPFEFSGGMRQRVVIAMALITEPDIIIADEPTTALDVTVQAQILNLISELQQRRNIGVIFISHDLSVVADIADRIAVMKEGVFVEQDSRDRILLSPGHDYTRQLLDAIPTTEKAPKSAGESRPLVELSELTLRFAGGKRGPDMVAVNNVSLDIQRHEILGLVGESGSGKSTLGRCILRLLNPSGGRVCFDGEDISHLDMRRMKPFRKRMQMIFQDPYASLNPRMSVYDTLCEPLLLHRICTRREVDQEVFRLMDAVGLDRASVRRYPHEFSGGQRQRIAIGRAIATRPEFIVADEPVSALDVTIQAQILELMLDLVARYDLTMLFISHDLGVVRYLADRILVMHRGRIVESGSTHEIFHSPGEDYTRALLQAIPGKSLLSDEGRGQSGGLSP